MFYRLRECMPRLMYLAVYLISLAFWVGSFVSAIYKPCTRIDQQYQGYTFYEDDLGKRIWSHCKFPSPGPTSKLCAVDQVWPGVRICDPDDILSDKRLSPPQQYVREMGDTLAKFVEEAAPICDYDTKSGTTESWVISLVTLDRIRLADTTSTELCANECGVLYPILTNTSLATIGDVNAAGEVFVSHLAEEWGVGLCDNQFSILYVNSLNKMWINYGKAFKTKLDNQFSTTVFNNMKLKVTERNNSTSLGEVFLQSLEYMAEEFTLRRQSWSPAVILMLINVAILLLIVLVYMIFLGAFNIDTTAACAANDWKLDIAMAVLWYLSFGWAFKLMLRFVFWIFDEAHLAIIIMPVIFATISFAAYMTYLGASGSFA